MVALVEYLKTNDPEDDRVKRLIKNFNSSKIVEILPTSEYTAYSENKGRKIAFCLNKKKEDNNHLIDEHTLMFVATHELSHIATKSIGHKDEFWNNFKRLLKEAIEANLYTKENYSQNPREYCGIKVSDSPLE
jgi:hypothetical protein